MTKQNSYTAMITQHAFMFLSSYEKLREKLLNYDFVNMAHLGARAFEEIGGEVVQTTSFVLRKSSVSNYMAVYSRLVDYNNQQAKEEAFLAKNDLYTALKENFSKIPGSPIAYWVSEEILLMFKAPQLGQLCDTRKGLATSDNNRFLKLWFEVVNNNIFFGCNSNDESKNSKQRWYPINKGGEYRRWYGNNEYVINWENDGVEIRNFRDQTGKLLSRPQNLGYNFKQAITWTKITSSLFSARLCYGNFLFDDASAICHHKDIDLLKYILGFLNSKCCQTAVKLLNPTMNIQIGDISNLPIIINQSDKVISLTSECYKISKIDWDSFETSWDFKRHPLIKFKRSNALWGDPTAEDFRNNGSIQLSYSAWKAFTELQFSQLKSNEEELNRIFIEIYGLQDELTPDVKDKDVTVRKADLTRDIKSFISYAVGCMLGRYSLDAEGLAYAGGEWDDSKYTTFIPVKDNCISITDEKYLNNDIVGLFVAFIKKVYGEATLEENLDFIAEALGNKGSTSREIIRNYFIKDFYKDHVKTYQKRPIYWLYDSGKQDGFKALVYMHRYNADTTGIVRVDYLHKIQKIYTNEIDRMQDTIENSTQPREVAKAEKRKEKLLKQLKETKEYDGKIAHIALSRIEIDLDDGVKVNYEKAQTGKDGTRLDILAKI